MIKEKNIIYAPWMILAVLVMGGFSFASIAQNNQESVHSLAVDFDQDGLSNDEEDLYGTDRDNRDTDGDGYSDGVEVESGYDPLIPASKGDRIDGLQLYKKSKTGDSTKTKNLTNEFNTRVAGITIDILGGKEVSLSDVSDEIKTTINGEFLEESLPKIDISKIKIKVQKYDDMKKSDREKKIKKDVSEYITEVSYIAATHSPQSIESAENMEVFSKEITSELSVLEGDYTNLDYFQKFIPRGRKMLDDMMEIEVPEVMVPLHMEGLQLAQYSVVVGDELEGRADDPVAAVVVFSKVQALIAKTMEFSEKIDEQMQKYDIKF